MQSIQYFVGLDVHKQVIAFCVKTSSREIVREGTVRATRAALGMGKDSAAAVVWRNGSNLFSHWSSATGSRMRQSCGWVIRRE